MATLSSPDPRRNGAGNKPGMNTLFNLDYGREVPFNNLIKQSRDEWVRNFSDTFDGTLDSNGYITDPGTAASHNQVVVISESAANMLPHGNYVLTWSGTGTCEIVTTGTIAKSTVSTAANRIVYNITDWGDADLVYLRVPVASIDVTDVVFCHEDYEGTCGPGGANEFYQEFLNAYAPYTGGIRFMNWQATNQKEGWTSWSNRKPESYRTYTHGNFDGGLGRVAEPGIPLEVCIRAQNKLGIPGWYCIPHEYDDTSVESFCDMLAANVDNELKVVVEYSNETWNGGFPQNAYCETQGDAEHAASGRFANAGGGFTHWQWAAYRATQCMDIARTSFASRLDDLVTVLGLQVGSSESQQALDVDVAVNFGVDTPILAYTKFDAASPAFYWGNATLMEPQWSNGGAADNAADSLRDGATKNTINMTKEEVYQWWESTYADYESDVLESTSWAYWVDEVKTQRGLEMLGYEGQHHVVTIGSVQGNASAEAIVDYYEEERFGDLTRDWILDAERIGFDTLFHFVLIEADSEQGGYWGLVPTYTALGDQSTYQRYRGVREATGQNNKRGI